MPRLTIRVEKGLIKSAGAWIGVRICVDGIAELLVWEKRVQLQSQPSPLPSWEQSPGPPLQALLPSREKLMAVLTWMASDGSQGTHCFSFQRKEWLARAWRIMQCGLEERV